MKVLILTDIHGNWPALQAVLQAEPDADRILCLGDLVNYGPQPGECVRWAGGSKKPKPFKHISLRGLNPEAIVIYPEKGLREFQFLSDDSKLAKHDLLSTFKSRKSRSVWVRP
jgi:hypothetical protein